MKKLFTIVSLFATLCGRAQSWINTGTPGFSGNYADNIKMAIGDSTPFVAYRDYNNGYGVTVRKFDGSNWLNVGTPNLSNEYIDYLSLAMRGNSPYVAFMDYNFNGATVKKFDGTNWINIGTPGFSGGGAENISLAMNDSTPYIAYMDDNKNGITVMKFDSSHWATVGTPAFSNGYADNLSIAMIGDTPYVAYMDYYLYSGIVVKKFDGANWVNVGTPGFSGAQADRINLVTSGSIPYVAFRDFNYYAATLYKFDGTNWVTVGAPGFSGYVDFISLAVKDSTPYVAYQDYNSGYGCSVQKFDGSSWVVVGDPNFTNGQADNINLVIKDSTPYVAYMDYNNGGVSVSQLDNPPPTTTPATGLKFDAVNDYVNCGNSPGVNNLGLNGFTLEAWVKPSNVGPAVSIIRKSGDYNLYIAGGKLNVEYWYNGPGTPDFIQFSGTIAIPTNAWTHVAATWNGTTASLYVNGVLNNGVTIPRYGVYAEDLWLGRSFLFGNQYSGSMDEVRIWNRALCQSEIQNNMNGEIDPAQQTGLMAYYQFNQGDINANNTGLTTAADASVNGNDGTLNNFSLTGSTSNWAAGTVSGSAPVFVPATLSGTADGVQVCQSGTVHAAETYYIDSNCNLIAGINPSGASPVTGTVNTCVQIDASIQFYGGHPYVQRHYDITPVTNAANATATVTLYYTQAEFDDYNLVRGINPALPATSSDATGIANVLITQYHGAGTAPGNYTGAAVLINPDDNNIIWNNTLSRWEITFDVTGFSGFYVHTNPGSVVLPLHLLSFSGTKQTNSNLLQWQTSNEINTQQFIIERSTDGRNFNSIGTLPAKGIDNARYGFTDTNPFTDNIYYRLKMVDNDGKFTYSNIIRLTNQTISQLAVYPNPVKDFITVQANDRNVIGTTAKIIDMSGKTIKTFLISNNFEIVDMSGLSAGLYLLQTANGNTQKLIKK